MTMGAPLVSLAEIARIQKGSTITANNAVHGEVPVIAGGTKPAYFHNESNREANAITVSASGAAGYLSFHPYPIFASDCITVESLDVEVVDQRYLFLALLSMQDHLYSLSRGTALQHVYAKDLKPLKIPIPLIDDQKLLVSALDEQLSRLEKTLADVQSNEARFKTLSEVLIRNLFDDDFDSMSLGDVFKVIDCEHKTAPRAVTEIAGFSIGTSAIRHGVIDFAKAKPVATETLRNWTARAKPVLGDVLFTREAPIGESALVPETPEICLGQRTVLIQKNLSIFEPEYLHLWLQSPQVRDWIGRHSTGTTVLHLNVVDVKKIPLPKTPPISEQQRLVQKLKEQQALARDAVREVPRIANQINQLKRAILFGAFNESSRT